MYCNKKTTPQDGVESKFGIVKLYADNVLHSLELSIYLSIPDWCEFSTQPFYPQLMEYLGSLEIQDNIGILEKEQSR